MVNVGKDTIPGSYGIAFDTQNLRLVKFKGILIYEGGGRLVYLGVSECTKPFPSGNPERESFQTISRLI